MNSLHALDSAIRANDAIVSAISFWEMGMLIRKGRFELEMGLSDWRRSVLGEGLIEVQVDGEIGLTAGLLPPPARGPCGPADCSDCYLLRCHSADSG